MNAKNIGQSELMFVTTENADLLYMKPHARKPSFPGPVAPSATRRAKRVEKILRLPGKGACHP